MLGWLVNNCAHSFLFIKLVDICFENGFQKEGGEYFLFYTFHNEMTQGETDLQNHIY